MIDFNKPLRTVDGHVPAQSFGPARTFGNTVLHTVVIASEPCYVDAGGRSADLRIDYDVENVPESV